MKNLVCTVEDQSKIARRKVILNRLEKNGDLTPLHSYTYVCDQSYVRNTSTYWWDANYKWVNRPNEKRERKAHGKLLDWYLKNVA